MGRSEWGVLISMRLFIPHQILSDARCLWFMSIPRNERNRKYNHTTIANIDHSVFVYGFTIRSIYLFLCVAGDGRFWYNGAIILNVHLKLTNRGELILLLRPIWWYEILNNEINYRDNCDKGECLLSYFVNF